MTDAEHTPVTLSRIKAERAAAGLPELIQDPAVYRLLGAVIDASQRTTHRD
jgi:hypothetical protein